MNGLSGIGLLTSFAAGVISFLSPCVLPLVPGYVSYVAGDALTTSGEPIRPVAALRLSLCFVLGFSTVFVILGASATSIGQRLLSYRYEANLAGGTIVSLLGPLPEAEVNGLIFGVVSGERERPSSPASLTVIKTNQNA